MIWSICLYVAACALPALVFHVRTDRGTASSVWTGYRTESGFFLLTVGLIWGWLRFNFTAYSNLLLWLSWLAVARKHYVFARGLSLAALIVSIETLQLLVQPMLWDEGGVNKGFLAAPHVGFLFWIASMAIVALSSQQRLSALRQVRVKQRQ